MKIELKNIKFYESLSEETNCFTADVFIDGKKIAYAQNRGQGGETYIQHYEGKKEILAQAEAFAKNLPPIKSEYTGDDLPMDLEFHVDLLLEDYIKAMDLKKLQKNFQHHICIGSPVSYTLSYFNGKLNGKTVKVPIAKVLQDPKGVQAIKDIITRGLARDPDAKVLNDNLPEEVLTLT